MPRVLILSAPFGAGHARVAAALEQAFAAEGARVEALDHFRQFVPPAFVRASLTVFWATLRWAPRLWGLAYAFSARLPNQSVVMGGMNRLGARPLLQHLRTTRPDVVVHAHPASAGALAWLRARGEADVPHGIVLTDWVAHPQWIYPGLERYFVPADEIVGGVAALGVAADRIVASGIPIDPAFAMPADRPALRLALGLLPAVPTVLVTGGMQGAFGGIGEVCDVLAGLAVPFQAVVVCGTHRRLQEALAARFRGDARVRVLGRVTEMHRVMGAVDLVVTKAGGLTCAEALALERPLVFYGSLPGQERANEAFLERGGAGIRAADRTALARDLASLVREPARRARFAAAAGRLRRPDAGRVVAKEMLALVGRARR